MIVYSVAVEPHLVSGTTHDGGEDGTRGIVPGEACLAQTGAVITHKGGAFFVVTHLSLL